MQAQQAYWWSENQIEQRLEERMHPAYDNVVEMARQQDVPLPVPVTVGARR